MFGAIVLQIEFRTWLNSNPTYRCTTDGIKDKIKVGENLHVLDERKNTWCTPSLIIIGLQISYDDHKTSTSRNV